MARKQGTDLDFQSTSRPVNVPAPSASGDGVNKGYVDSAVLAGGTPASPYVVDIPSNPGNDINPTTPELITELLVYSSVGSSAPVQLNSVNPGSGRGGRQLTIKVDGANNKDGLDINHQVTSGTTAAWRFYLPQAYIHLDAGQAATFIYDTTINRWVLAGASIYPMLTGSVPDYYNPRPTGVLRDTAGRAQMEAPSAGKDIVNKTYADGLGESIGTPSTIVRRDTNGRTEVAAPTALGEAANKDYVDNTAGTASPTTNTLVRRDGAGRAAFVDPSASGDAATKNYVDATAGAVSPSANSLARRRSDGTLEVITPVNSGEAANKGYVDVTAGTTLTTGGTLARRTGIGTLRAEDPVTNQDLTTKQYVDQIAPTGSIMMWPGRTAPAGWLLCIGSVSAYLRASYPDLFALLNPIIGTVTTTIASPAVLTRSAHGFQTGQRVYLSTTGALPTGLDTDTDYYAIRIDANTFNLATTLANALAGTKINTTGSQSGTHSVGTTYGRGNPTGNYFQVPDLTGRVSTGLDASQAEFASLGQTGGVKAHTHTSAAHTHTVPAHTHPLSANGWALTRIANATSTIYSKVKSVASWTANTVASFSANATASTSSISNATELDGTTDSGGSGNTGSTTPGDTGTSSTLAPYITLNYIIKT